MYSTRVALFSVLIVIGTLFTGCMTDSKKEPTGTALSAESNFVFRRVSQTDTSGLDQFGLTWTGNTGTPLAAIISKGTASKLVVLASTDWASITTKEALMAKVDSAVDTAHFLGVDFDTPPNAFDLVIATISGGNYFILHITGSDDIPGTPPLTPADRVRTITGTYKR